MKNPIVLRDVPEKPKSTKDDFLNEAQRRELKKMLTEKFTKLYGLCNPAAVEEEVTRFFKANTQINQKALVELENTIKRVMLKHKSKVQAKPGAKPSEPPKEAPQAPVVRVAEETSANEGACKRPMPTGMQGCAEFEGLEYEEWDNIGVYQAFILKQEKELERKKKQLEQKAIRSQLAHQVNEKGRREQEVKGEHESYVGLEQQQYQRFLKHQEELVQLKQKEKKEIFDMQTKMIQARNAQLDKEKRIQDEIDKKIMDTIQTDLAKQREVQQLRAEAKRQEMMRVRSENDARKQRKLEAEERERKEEIELQRLANELAQDLENQRTAEIKAKADKIQQMMLIGDHALKNQKQKTQEEEKKLLDYIEKKNRLIELKDRRMKEREKENKTKYREILDLQVKERDEKAKAEREYIREQAVLWKQEEDYYNQFNETKANTQKAGLDEYKRQLEEQVKEKDERKKKGRGGPVADEDKIKALLMEQIRNLELQNQILNEQLKD